MQIALVGRVEAARRLIGKNHARAIDERTRHSHALAFAARELRGFVVQALAQAQIVEQFGSALHGIALLVAAQQGRNSHIFERRKLRQELVKLKYEAYVAISEVGELVAFEFQHIHAVVNDAAAIGRVESAENLQQSGFAGAAGTHDGHHLLLADYGAHIAQHLQRAVAFIDVFYFYHNGGKNNTVLKG